jgi:hypothetical protein
MRESFTEPTEFRLKMGRPATEQDTFSASNNQVLTKQQNLVDIGAKQLKVRGFPQEVKHWGSKIFRCPQCSTLNNPVYGNFCESCDSKITNDDLINNLICI